MRRKFTIVLAIALATVMANSSALFATHAWSNYHWARKTNPFTLKLGDNLTSNWDASLATVSTDWSQAAEIDTIVVVGLTDGRRCAAQLGRIEVCNSRYGNNGWLGLAQVWITADGHITKGTAKVNDTYFNTTKYNNPSARLHVICQEVAHAFGLGHQALGTDSCMNDKDRLNDPLAAHPNAHDFEQLTMIYAHMDASTTVAKSAANTGHAASRGGNHDHVISATALPDGGTLLTFVVPAS